MLKMVDGTGIIGVDMVCPLGATVSPPQPPNYDNIEMEGVGSLMLPNSLKAPLERVELIGNSMQGENPSPDNPQEIKSVGRKSRNLFDITKLKKGVNTNYPTEIELVGETFIAKKEGGTSNQMVFETELANLEPNTTYELTTKQIICKRKDLEAESVGKIFSFRVYNNGNQIENKGNAFTTSGNKSDIYKILFAIIGGDFASLEYVKIEQLMLSHNKGAYEPYGYLLDLKVTGENLFDISKVQNTSDLINNGDGTLTLTAKGTSGKNTLKEICPDLIVGETYTFKFDTNGINYIYCEGVWSDGTSKQITQAMLDSVVFFYNQMGVPVVTIKNIQINRGTKAMPYSQYCIPQTVQIALNEPLRGIGEYKDVLTKDGVVRKIYPPYEINLNDLRDGGYSKTNTVMFSVKVQNKTVGYASSKPSILCNILPDCALQMSNIYNNDKECIAVGGGIVLFRVNKSRLKDMSSFEATKQSFIELMADKKMIVEYALETPVTEPLPESVQQQLQALHSENGTTHVFVDSGEVEAGIKLTYRKEK